MKILYGTYENNIDITNMCLTEWVKNNVITIPEKHEIFTDRPTQIIIVDKNNNSTTFLHYSNIEIDLADNTIKFYTDIDIKLENIQGKLKLKYGSFLDELPEQKMVCRYIKGHEKVLEIGGNIGRNSLVIGSLLNDHNNLLVLESHEIIAKQLIENRDINEFKFHIENAALSNRKLLQNGWNTIPYDEKDDNKDFHPINTITLKELYNKYKIDFDTLVLDCEGAFYYILVDMPEILNNINLIIMENDYLNPEHKKYVDDVLIKNNFYLDFNGGWKTNINFFQVWKRNI